MSKEEKKWCNHSPVCRGVREHLLTMGDFRDEHTEEGKEMNIRDWADFYQFCMFKSFDTGVLLLEYGCTHDEIYSALFPLFLEERGKYQDNLDSMYGAMNRFLWKITEKD